MSAATLLDDDALRDLTGVTMSFVDFVIVDDDVVEREDARFDFFAGVSGLRRFAALVMAAATAAMRRVYEPYIYILRNTTKKRFIYLFILLENMNLRTNCRGSGDANTIAFE